MDDNPASHAMTEVALGLAMAFFSIMVLSMVSMSVPHSTPREERAAQVQGVGLAPPAQTNDKTAQTLKSEDLLLVYHRQQFLDRHMKPVDVSRIPAGQRIVLALPPSLSLEQAMRARRKISAPDLIITSLDKRWTTLLEATP